MQCVCSFWISGNCFCICQFVSLSWWMCFVCDSDCVSGCACASWFYKSYLPAADVEYSFLLRSEPSDLGRRWVLTCPGDILNDWKFFLSTWRVFAYLSLGRGGGGTLDLFTTYVSSLLSLSCCTDSHNGLPIMAADCHPRGTSVLV